MKTDNILTYFRATPQRGLATALIAITIVLLISAGLRYNQLETWREFKEFYFVDKMPQTTTLDSYKWLRYAEEYKAGTYYPSDTDSRMFYPDHMQKHDKIPMLSWLIAKLSVFSDGNIYRTAIYLTPFLASLFVIPLGLYFFFLGMLPAGVAGGLTGALSVIYLNRTAIGRVDTDVMNLFFPFLSSMFILLAINAKSDKKLYIHSALAGLSMWLFFWWYEHPGITLAYLAVFAFTLLVSKTGIKRSIIALVLFILFSNPMQYYSGLYQILSFVHTYLTPTGNISVGFPDIYATITETRGASPSEVLDYLAYNPVVSTIGLLLFVVCFVFNFKKILPLLPVFVLGLLVFKSASRLGMFLAPFVGIGIGYGFYVLSRLVRQGSPVVENIKLVVFTTVSVVFMVITLRESFYVNPSPSIEVGVYKQIKELKKIAPKDAVIYSWWDYGLAYEYGGFTTFHDGMSQRTPKTYYISKSLMSSNPQELYNTIAFLADQGMKGINTKLDEGKSPSEISAMVAENDLKVTPDKYVVLFTRDMLSKIGALSQISTWNFATGQYDPYLLQYLNCTSKEGDVLICGNNFINLSTGLVNNAHPLKSHTVVVNGKLFNHREFPYSKGLYLVESRSSSGFTDFIIMEDRAYYSNLVQMLVIGNIDTSRFTEIFNAVPYMRAFTVNGR